MKGDIMGYTKGKWITRHDKYSDYYAIQFEGSGKCEFICSIISNKADAEHIIRCVNSHDALLETCKGFNFTPDCGGDFCIEDNGTWFGETTTQEKCSQIGYCKWAYAQTQLFKAAIAQAEK